jgi:hypothetical protein
MEAAAGSVQKNLALADLDELLRALLQRELEAVQMRGVEVTFDAPTKERSSAWRLPAINLFLYDLREAAVPRDRGWHNGDEGGSPALVRAPLRLDCTFAITAWTRDVVDEHQLLSQVLSVMLAYPVLPADMLPPSLQVGSPPADLWTRVGQAKDERRADFWAAIGSPFKVSLEYLVTIHCRAGQALARGAPVAGTAVSEALKSPRQAQGGHVLGAGGEAAEDVWVVLPALGPWTRTDADGRFEFADLPRGSHAVMARGADGATATATIEVPGPPALLRFAPVAAA